MINIQWNGYIGNKINSILVLFILLILTSCTKMIARQINQAENIVDSKYPPAHTNIINLKKSADLNLEHYKLMATRPNANKEAVIAVAISGGGYRSANLASGVLLGLEKIHNHSSKTNLLQQIDYFSTVSGGGLAVGFYLTRLYNYLQYHIDSHHFSLQKTINQMLAYDRCCPNPLRANLMPYLFSSNENGYQVEKILNDTLLRTPQGGLREGDIFIPKNASQPVLLPYWIINTTIFQNASIFPFVPSELDTYQIIGFHHRNLDYIAPVWNPNLAYSMPLSVGLTASISVPIAFPSTTLVSNRCHPPCYLQLYDGGVADNLGINTAVNLLRQDSRKIKILMVIDSGKDLLQPFSKHKAPPDGMPLLVRLTTFSTDGYRKYIKSHLNFLARKILCGKGASHVIVIYFDLEGYPQTQKIRSDLEMTLDDQKKLLTIGQEIVAKDKTLREFLSQLSKGQLTLGQCNGVE